VNILLAFTPFLTFALLEPRFGAHGALLAATVVSGLLVADDILVRRKSMKPLETGSLILFGALAFASRSPAFSPSALVVRLLVNGGLLALVAGSLLVGRPFTLPYAREQVSPEVAASARFRAVNRKLSAAWALAFAVIVAADAAMLYAPGFTPLAGTVASLAALAGAALLTWRLPKAEACKSANR
jgi:hypothetical protein